MSHALTFSEIAAIAPPLLVLVEQVRAELQALERDLRRNLRVWAGGSEPADDGELDPGYRLHYALQRLQAIHDALNGDIRNRGALAQLLEEGNARTEQPLPNALFRSDDVPQGDDARQVDPARH